VDREVAALAGHQHGVVAARQRAALGPAQRARGRLPCPAQRVIVEVDSWRYHRTRRAFEDDRARDVRTTAAGSRTLRFTDRPLTAQPHHVAHAIAHVPADRRAA